MSPELQDSLDHASKRDRSPAHVARLMADGKRQACAFLEQRGFGKPIALRTRSTRRGSADPSGRLRPDEQARKPNQTKPPNTPRIVRLISHGTSRPSGARH